MVVLLEDSMFVSKPPKWRIMTTFYVRANDHYFTGSIPHMILQQAWVRARYKAGVSQWYLELLDKILQLVQCILDYGISFPCSTNKERLAIHCWCFYARQSIHEQVAAWCHQQMRSGINVECGAAGIYQLIDQGDSTGWSRRCRKSIQCNHNSIWDLSGGINKKSNLGAGGSQGLRINARLASGECCKSGTTTSGDIAAAFKGEILTNLCH